MPHSCLFYTEWIICWYRDLLFIGRKLKLLVEVIYLLRSLVLVNDTPFFRITPKFYQPVPFYGKILNASFLGKFRKLNPSPFYKGGSSYEAGYPKKMFCFNVEKFTSANDFMTFLFFDERKHGDIHWATFFKVWIF